LSKAERYVEGWLRHRSVLVELLERVPEGNIGFKPWAGAKGLGDLALHVCTAGQMWVGAVSTGHFVRPSKLETPESMAGLCTRVRELTKQTQDNLLALTDAQIEATVDGAPIFGFALPGSAWLTAMREHEIHHKGQLFVYARMTGAPEVPFFVRPAGTVRF